MSSEKKRTLFLKSKSKNWLQTRSSSQPQISAFSETRRSLMTKTTTPWDYIGAFNSVIKSDALLKLSSKQGDERLTFWKQKLQPLNPFELNPSLDFAQEFFHKSKKNRKEQEAQSELARQKDLRQIELENLRIIKEQIYQEMFSGFQTESTPLGRLSSKSIVRKSAIMRLHVSHTRNANPSKYSFSGSSNFPEELQTSGFERAFSHQSLKSNSNSTSKPNSNSNLPMSPAVSLLHSQEIAVPGSSPSKLVQMNLDRLLNSLSSRLVKPRTNFLLLRVAEENAKNPKSPGGISRSSIVRERFSQEALEKIKKDRIANLISCEQKYKIFMKQRSFIQKPPKVVHVNSVNTCTAPT